jgi:hypothetical protein
MPDPSALIENSPAPYPNAILVPVGDQTGLTPGAGSRRSAPLTALTMMRFGAEPSAPVAKAIRRLSGAQERFCDVSQLPQRARRLRPVPSALTTKRKRLLAVSAPPTWPLRKARCVPSLQAEVR